VAYQGVGCAESDQSVAPRILLVKQSQEIPSTLSHAAVVLSGWHFRFLQGDHELLGLATGIFDIKRSGRDDTTHLLEWQAFGVMRDGNFGDPFRWCYRFTVLAWDSDAYALQVDQRDTHVFNGDAVGRDVPFGWETALSFHPSYVEVPSGGSGSTVILPRGFGFAWLGDDEDHNLLQLAYNLEPGARFISHDKQYTLGTPDLGGADQVGRYYSWETKTIFKDNALRRNYAFGELVSAASGHGTEAVHPPFTIVPVEDHSNCVPVGKAESESRSIGGVSFDVAIPVLTGWDLSYVCNDRHVQEIGVWLEDFVYNPGTPRPSSNGRLDYTIRSVLRDDGGGGAIYRHRMSVLGLRKLPPPPPPAPSLTIIPEVLRFPAYPGGPLTTRNAFLDNLGNAAATRTTVAIVGPDATLFQLASQHPATRTLGPGDSEQFVLRFSEPCRGTQVGVVSRSATLRIDTSQGRFDVPMLGQPTPCPAPEKGG
jgi:hypothetical protein